MYYSYWYADGNGVRHGQKDNKDDVIVYEDSNTATGIMVTYYKRCSTNGQDLWWFCSASGKKYEFHVPPGTIAHTFELK